MKHWVLILIALLYLSTTYAQNAQIIVKGSFKDTLLVTTYERVPLGQKQFKEYILDGYSQPEYTISIPENICSQRLYFSCNSNYTFLELKPGQSLTILLDGTDMSFSGDNEKINQYLYDWNQQYIMSFHNAYRYRLQMRNFFNRKRSFPEQGLDSPETITQIKQLLKQSRKQLKKSGIKDEAFIKRQNVWIKYLQSRILLENYRFLEWKNHTFSEDYKELLASIEFDDIDILQHPDANDMLPLYFKMQEQVFNVRRIIPNQIKLRAEALKHSELQEYYVINELNQLVRAQNSFLLDEILQNVSPLIKSEEGKTQLESLKPKVDMLVQLNMRGQDAYAFEFEDVAGKLVRMTDFKGKYVFIDVWATWCGPCNMNIPYVEKLEKALHDENIAFVSVSIDKQKDKQKWIDFLNQTPISGTAVIAEAAFKSQICEYYGIQGIPRFILVDPEGKIVSARCRQPRDEGFRNYLVDFMKKH